MTVNPFDWKEVGDTNYWTFMTLVLWLLTVNYEHIEKFNVVEAVWLEALSKYG